MLVSQLISCAWSSQSFFWYSPEALCRNLLVLGQPSGILNDIICFCFMLLTAEMPTKMKKRKGAVMLHESLFYYNSPLTNIFFLYFIQHCITGTTLVFPKIYSVVLIVKLGDFPFFFLLVWVTKHFASRRQHLDSQSLFHSPWASEGGLV